MNKLLDLNEQYKSLAANGLITIRGAPIIFAVYAGE